MTTLRVLLVDDERLARVRLRSVLEAVGGVEVAAEAGSARQAEAAARAGGLDAAFVDVEMPGPDGLVLAPVLRRAGIGAIAFVTAHAEHAAAAFDAAAVDYVLKPFTEERVARAVARLRERLDAGGLAALREEVRALGERVAPPAGWSKIAVRDRERIRYVDPATIDWVEAEEKYCRLHCGARSELVREAIGALEARLDPREFVRVHRGALVRLGAVRELAKDVAGEFRVVLASGARLPIGRTYRERLERRGLL